MLFVCLMVGYLEEDDGIVVQFFLIGVGDVLVFVLFEDDIVFDVVVVEMVDVVCLIVLGVFNVCVIRNLVFWIVLLEFFRIINIEKLLNFWFIIMIIYRKWDWFYKIVLFMQGVKDFLLWYEIFYVRNNYFRVVLSKCKWYFIFVEYEIK